MIPFIVGLALGSYLGWSLGAFMFWSKTISFLQNNGYEEAAYDVLMNEDL